MTESLNNLNLGVTNAQDHVRYEKPIHYLRALKLIPWVFLIVLNQRVHLKIAITRIKIVQNPQYHGAH